MVDEGLASFVFLRDLCLLYCCIIIFARNPIPETCSTHRITDHTRLSDIQEHERSIQGGIVPAMPYNGDEIARRVNGRSLRPRCNTRARVVTSATRFQIPVTHRNPGGARGCGGKGSAALGVLKDVNLVRMSYCSVLGG